MKRRIHPALWVLIAVGVLSVLGLLPPLFLSSSRMRNDRIAPITLQTIQSAQADFRHNDRDGNGVQDYWRADIAGLYGLEARGERIKLIEISAAGADAAPAIKVSSFITPGPKAGYFFRALLFQDEQPGKPDPQRFAATCYPATPHAGKLMFLAGHDGAIWKKPAIPGGPPVYPADPAKAGWVKMD